MKVDSHPTLHHLMDDLEIYLNLTPEQKFRVAAKIKRYVHNEKSLVYLRYSHYADPKTWIQERLQEGYEKHEKLSELPDEEVITFEMGSFNPKAKNETV